MADQRDGGIAWTDQTWNPLRGCRRISPGCVHCYAETVAGRFCGPGQPYAGLAERTPSGPRWTGAVRLVEEHLGDPLRWTRPRRVFVNSMSDLFHEDVPDEWIDRIFAVMAIARPHTFQVLTKRSERMRAYFANQDVEMRVADAAVTVAAHLGVLRQLRLMERIDALVKWSALTAAPSGLHEWPLPNVWLGVSVEDQPRADERIPLLLQTPAAMRFISAEPLLGPVDLYRGGFTLLERVKSPSGTVWPGLDWVIVGGESGPGARPCDVRWVRDIVGQCRDAGVACFVKQLGADPGEYRDVNRSDGALGWFPLGGYRRALGDRKGGDPAEWPADLRVREWPR